MSSCFLSSQLLAMYSSRGNRDLPDLSPSREDEEVSEFSVIFHSCGGVGCFQKLRLPLIVRRFRRRGGDSL